jgi:hypothetical protein
MTLAAGDAGCTTGLSKRIYDYRTGAVGNGYSSPLLTAQATMLKLDCYAIALAFVDEVTANGEAVITVTTDGLQRAGGTPTTAPNTEQTIRLR